FRQLPAACTFKTHAGRKTTLPGEKIMKHRFVEGSEAGRQAQLEPAAASVAVVAVVVGPIRHDRRRVAEQVGGGEANLRVADGAGEDGRPETVSSREVDIELRRYAKAQQGFIIDGVLARPDEARMVRRVVLPVDGHAERTAFPVDAGIAAPVERAIGE